MNTPQDIKDVSCAHVKYDRHREEWDLVLSNPQRKEIGDTWFNVNTLDYWRHTRMRAPIQTIINNDEFATWLTIGDGRFGTDANYLIRMGVKSVHCTDVSDTLLKLGKERGFITSYSAENAESLSFSENSFDYVYCKESFHHFPRPSIALHEMFRVAKKAVILIEPRDLHIDKSAFYFVFQILKLIFAKSHSQHDFEPVGNYVYCLSEREVEKFLLGMHFNKVAFIGCNDAYTPGVEFTPLNSEKFRDRKMRFEIKAKIMVQNILVKLRFKKTRILTAVLFKETPPEKLILALKQAGWDYRNLPANPYIKE